MSRRGRRDGWVVLHDLVPTDEIDAAVADLWTVFPKPDKFHDDPARYIPPGKDTETLRRGYPEMPEHGPGFRPEQHRWGHEFPFMGTRRARTACTCTRRSSTSPNGRSRRVTSGCTNRT